MSFLPDPRSAGKQRFCAKPLCRSVSKKASQARWLESGKGKTYHRGEAGIHRVREWRAAHPGYWRRKDSLGTADAELPCDLREMLAPFSRETLQDSWSPHVVALVGLIARLCRPRGGRALQDSIARELREIMVAGDAILASLHPADSKRERPSTREPR